MHVCMYVCIYIYIYIYSFICRPLSFCPPTSRRTRLAHVWGGVMGYM